MCIPFIVGLVLGFRRITIGNSLGNTSCLYIVLLLAKNTIVAMSYVVSFWLVL